MTTAIAQPLPAAFRAPRPTPLAGALWTLARRRAALTARNPRQIALPLLTPILFAVVIAPALKTALGGLHSHIDDPTVVYLVSGVITNHHDDGSTEELRAGLELFYRLAQKQKIIPEVRPLKMIGE